jgi:hypothetical protein
LAALGVLITLIYLSRQVRQGNMLAKYQARQRMVEQAQEELYHWRVCPGLRDSFVKKEPLTGTEQEDVHYFLLAALRQREWEWFQFRRRGRQVPGDSTAHGDVFRADQSLRYERRHPSTGVMRRLPS